MFTGPRLDRRGNLEADSGHICITMTLGSRGASAASFRPMDKLQPCRAYVPPLYVQRVKCCNRLFYKKKYINGYTYKTRHF